MGFFFVQKSKEQASSHRLQQLTRLLATVRNADRRAQLLSEDPADRNPLVVCVESVQRPPEAAVGSIQVVIHNAQVKIVTVRPLDPFAFVHCPFEL